MDKIRNLYYKSKIGYITGEMKDDGYFMVYKFVLFPEFRGKGLARELAKHIPKKAKLLAAPLYNRDTGPVLDVDPLVKFYQSIGFKLKPDQYNNKIMIREEKDYSFKDFLLENYKEITEAPIGDYETYGDFSPKRSFIARRIIKKDSFADPKDRMLITNPRAIEYKRKKFGNSPIIWNLYFLNEQGAEKFAEYGLVNIEWLQKNIKNKELINKVSRNQGKDCISVIFTNNLGDEAKGMSPWIVAHRIMHALKKGDIKKDYYTKLANYIIEKISNILSHYNINNFPTDNFNLTFMSSKEHKLIIKDFFQEICTFKSARDKNIRDWYETFNELGAQYIITGKIKFNPAPKCFISHQKKYCTENNEKISEVLQKMTKDIELIIENMFKASTGNIFVM